VHLRSKVLLVLACLFIQTAVVAAAPQINSEAVYVMNADNNKVLYEKNGDIIMYPASTTKIMTTLVAMKHGDLDSVVTVSSTASGVEGSSLELKPGDQLTLRDLLRGMMAVSGNDAAQAVAEHVGGGSAQVFINWMNEEAAALGATHTHFSNPHGLPDPDNHYTTAHDLAIITAYAYQQPGFVDFVSHKYQTIRYINRGTSEKVESFNELLEVYPGSNGVKSGTTRAAGQCLVAGAKRNGVQLIAVVLKSGDRWKDATTLLDYGFEQTGLEQAAEKAAVTKSATTDEASGKNAKLGSAEPSGTEKSVQLKSGTAIKPNGADQAVSYAYNSLLEFSAYGGGSADAAYLSKAKLFGMTGYIGPAVRYDSHKTSKTTVGARLAMPILANEPSGADQPVSFNADRLFEFGVYGNGSADAAYLSKVEIFNSESYIGPAVKYDSHKASKLNVGVRLTVPL